MTSKRQARLFRNGRNQAVRIPRELELPGDEVVIRKEGESLIITPTRRRSLATLLEGWTPLEEGLPDTDTGLPALDDIRL